MTTLDDLHAQRWHLINPKIPYVAANGIPTFWRSHSELGSPIGPETTLDDGSVAQAFSAAIVRWDAASGARVATE